MSEHSKRAYQAAAVAGASLADLHVIVYDNLARAFIKCAEAVRQSDITSRCAASKHALLLIGHVESWLDSLDEPQLVASLRQFYAVLRARIVALQTSPDERGFEELASFVFENRAAWQTLSMRKEGLMLPTPQPSTQPVAAARMSFTA